MAAYGAAMRDPEPRGRGGARYSWATVPRASGFGIVALIFVLAGCAGSVGASTSPTSSGHPSQAEPTPATLPAATPTVAQTPGATPAPMHQESIAVGDDERVVDMFVPPLPTGDAPLLLLLHANGESPYLIANESQAGELAAREGVIVALPPARDHRWNVMVSPGDAITPSADVAYVVGLIDKLGAELPIDMGRVFVAGFSMGAVTSERIGCQFADRVAAVALNAGAPWSDECSPSRPLPILVMHGTADNTFRIGLAGEVVSRWRAADGCQGEPVVSQLSDIATSELNDDCAGGVKVQYVRYQGAGHRWFANPDATEVMWSFFAGFATP
jgi:polyhydroxybutyrate depolymerase